MRSTVALALGAATLSIGASLAFIASGAQGQAAPAPTRYEMDIGTSTGFGFGPGGARPSIGQLLGRGNNEARHELLLRLGSPTSPASNAAPMADHFMPPVARLGASVPLVTPQVAPDDETDRVPRQTERPGQPQGRILIFWGCGAHAPAGQPVIIDLSRLGQNQIPLGLFTTSVPRQREVSFANSRTYGDWPNARSRANVSPQSSLIGQHRVSGNYSPEIAFSLTQDFMGGLQATSAAQADGSVLLNWNSVPQATGYYAWTMGFQNRGGGQSGDIVWWSSSSSQQFGGGLWDWLSPAVVAGLITRHVVMPPSQTSCQIPVEVKRAAPDFMLGNLYGYGPEADFAFPPRPANARTPWRPIWTARARYRTHTGWMIGGPGAQAGNQEGAGQEANGNPPANDPERCRRRGGLGGIVGRVVRLPGC